MFFYFCSGCIQTDRRFTVIGKEFPSAGDINEAHLRIKNNIHRTPIFTSQIIDGIAGSKIFFKCENFQKTGAFKIRGASNSINSMKSEELINGVTTHSSGNHAAAVALAAKLKGIKAYIVMPENAPSIKRKAVAGYGAEIIFSEATKESREEKVENVIAETGAAFIHPYNDDRIITGQATCAKEFFEEADDLDFIITPVSGGGLLSGTALSAKYFAPQTKIIGVEPKAADDAMRSLRDGKIYPAGKPETIADGLRMPLAPRTFEILQKYADEILTVEEETIIEAMKLIWTRMKIIIEPSSAVTLAAVIENKNKFINKKIGMILSGGNVDIESLPWTS